jgi:hypothetical protein
VCVELKLHIGTPQQAWSVLCQVTHRAHKLAAGLERLAGAYRACLYSRRPADYWSSPQ